jgi:hypothetical protein
MNNQSIHEMTNSKNNEDRKDATDIPSYLSRWPGLYVRDGNQIVEASEEDISVARSYPMWGDKGQIIDGKRLTILTKKTTYQVNEEIRVIHVVEVTGPGHMVHVMGPKQIYGEHVDGQLVTEPLPERETPLVPSMYDGAVLPSPAVDYNYEITSYSFSKPGTHCFQWRLGPLESNVLTLEVTKVPSPENMP